MAAKTDTATVDPFSADAFATGEVPTDIYRTKVNPYAGMVAAIVDSGMNTDPKTGKLRSAESRTAVLPYRTDEEKKAVATVIRLAQEAGKTASYSHADGNVLDGPVTGVTVKKHLAEDGKGKVTLTLWATERITRTAKDGEGTETDSE